MVRYSHQIEFFLLDSQNRANLNKTDSEIEDFIRLRAVERVTKEGKKKWDQWQITVNTQALKDRNLLCGILTKSFLGGFTIFGYLWKEDVYQKYCVFLKDQLETMNLCYGTHAE